MSHINIVLNIIPTLVRVILYQCTEWLWKIVLLTLAVSRGVTDLYIYTFATKILEGNQPFADDVTDISDTSPATCFFCTSIDI